MQTMAMSPMDAAWFYIERREAPAHFGPLIILSPPKGSRKDYVKKLVDQWRGCTTFAPPFNYRLSRSKIPTWEVLRGHQIDLDYHLRHSALPAPGGERELGVLVSRLHSTRLDRQRPLWECNVIEGLENGRFAIFLKFHHGQMDGVGAARLISRVLSPDPEAKGMVPPWMVGMQSRTRPEGDRPKTKEVRKPRTGFNPAGLPAATGALVGLARDVLVDKKAETAAPFQAPNTVFNRRIGAQRRFATQHYDLARFKRVAKSADVTVNDVFLSIAGGALRRYLAEMGQLPDRSLVGQVPVNIRRAGDTSVGNKLAFIYAFLRTDIEGPVERLRAVNASTTAGKARHEALPDEAVESYTMLLLAPYMTQLLFGLGGLVPPAANLVISNVPGPKERLYFNGATVDQIYGPSVLFHGQALNITMSSYADQADIGFTGCRYTLPSMQKLAVYTGEALSQLEAALGVA
jgi:diacylglycerol O-acyltransferase